MNDVYSAPQSELTEPETETERETVALRKLLNQQRYILSPILALVFTLLTLLAMSLVAGRAPLLVFLLPAFIVGGLLKLVGRLILVRHRVISCLVVMALVFIDLLNTIFMAAIISALNFLICLALSRRLLSYEQEKLLYRWGIGKIKI